MRMGVHRDTLAPSLAVADEVWLFAPPDLGWDADAVVASLGVEGHARAFGRRAGRAGLRAAPAPATRC